MAKISKSFNSSENASKQRKFRAESAIHQRKKLMSSNLSKDLRKRHSMRSFQLRKGDTVRIMRGEFNKKTGKILEVNMKKLKVYIEGMQRSKRDGTKVNVPFDPSNLQITELNLDDKKRMKTMEKKK